MQLNSCKGRVLLLEYAQRSVMTRIGLHYAVERLKRVLDFFLMTHVDIVPLMGRTSSGELSSTDTPRYDYSRLSPVEACTTGIGSAQ